MMTLELRTLNDKHFECRVDCLGKLTPSDFPLKTKLAHFQLHLASR